MFTCREKEESEREREGRVRKRRGRKRKVRKCRAEKRRACCKRGIDKQMMRCNRRQNDTRTLVTNRHTD